MAEIGPLSRLMRSTALHVAFAVVVMGAWAAFANRAHGPSAMALAFAAQGILSGLITLCLKRGLEGAHARLPAPWASLLPPAATTILIGCLLTSAHLLAGTPEILRTIALPWTVSTLYAFAYVWSLGRDNSWNNEGR